MLSGSHRLVWWVYLLALLVAATALILLPWWTVDDAFISYRYGRNLLVHGELTWNVGESPFVEGYTGIFLPLLSAAILGLGLPLVETVKILGLLAMLGLLDECRRSLQRLGIDAISQSLAVLFLALTPLLYEHALSGLETIFFTFFITASVSNVIALKQKGNGKLPM
jgi:arabinofuranosyltransferase